MAEVYTSGNVNTRVYQHEQDLDNLVANIKEAIASMQGYVKGLQDSIGNTEIDEDAKIAIGDCYDALLDDLNKMDMFDLDSDTVEAFGILLEELE